MTTETEITDVAGRYAEMVRHLNDAENALDRARYHAELLGKEMATLPPPPPTELFANGTEYPDPPTVNVLDSYVQPGATEALVTLELTGVENDALMHTVRERIMLRNGVGGLTTAIKTFPYVFHPDGPLKQTIRVPVRNMKVDGNTLEVIQPDVPDGGKRGLDAFITVDSAQEPTAALPSLRAPLTFEPLGEIAFDALGKDIPFDDVGGGEAFITRLIEGRSHPGVGMTSYYDKAASGAYSVEGDDLVLHAEKLPEPVYDEELNNTVCWHRGAQLAGYRFPQVQFKTGSVEMVAKMPSRKGTWPALWLLQLYGWPPEIDIVEEFNQQSGWDPDNDLSNNIHGGKLGSNKQTFDRLASRYGMKDLGLPATLTSDYHAYQGTVDPEWITMFIDGVERFRYRNAFHATGKTWYPLIQLGVKAPRSDPFDIGKNTMEVQSLKVWRAE